MSDGKVQSKGRRSFFRAATLGVGAAGAAAVGLRPEQGQAADVDTPADDSAGYRETAHVKKYYELARF